MSSRWWAWTGVYVLVSVLAFVFLYWVLALFIAVMGLTLVVIGALASNWENHSTFEERELARARKRKQKWERDTTKRAKDRALWERHHREGAAER